MVDCGSRWSNCRCKRYDLNSDSNLIATMIIMILVIIGSHDAISGASSLLRMVIIQWRWAIPKSSTADVLENPWNSAIEASTPAFLFISSSRTCSNSVEIKNVHLNNKSKESQK
ncbi:hypothetical protein ASPWEDRAFT_356276 [Aspergillus wentii DTO 134E9]|uniref:Uncharacterized protein n=1 Tax=Aspergillus wentii DTO 134E9 TaxID=1073089 RepID=A0A1L9RW23_ASPWE|nr:uncharacterized protein ASPWEDRAFT_356276 [Aspergillus wentii DTO 134E9]OJJ39125.1 hypothetical protein ASPWEDRAFT_356276 [Aspergillus wentii DTO 134E9]